jgi:hypothetical protein
MCLKYFSQEQHCNWTGEINDSFRLLRSGAAPNFEGGVASFLWKSKFQQLVINGPFKSQALDRYKVISFCRVHAPRGWQLMQSVSSTIESKTS